MRAGPAAQSAAGERVVRNAEAGWVERLYTSSGSKWIGLPLSLHNVPTEPFTIEPDHSAACCVFKGADISWLARGRSHSSHWRPNTTVFLKKGFRITNHRTTGYQIGAALVEEKRFEALYQCDAKPSNIDFLEHVVGTDEQMAGILRAMIAEGIAGNPGGRLLAESLSVALLAHLLDRYDRGRAAKRLQGRLPLSQTTTIKRYVEAHLGQDLSVNELATLLHLSPAYFSKAFAKTVGVSPYRYVLNKRIAAAQSLLLKPFPPSGSELAHLLGFADKSHFSRTFRTQVGCSPSDFQRQNG